MIDDGIKKSSSTFFTKSCKFPNGESCSRENNTNEVILEEGHTPLYFKPAILAQICTVYEL